MNIKQALKNIFHFHKWETINSSQSKCKITDEYGFIKREDVSSFLILEQCSICKKERAFIDAGTDKEEVTVRYAKECFKFYNS